jgi:hypothetical protein
MVLFYGVYLFYVYNVKLKHVEIIVVKYHI